MDLKKRKVEENGSGATLELTPDDARKLIEPLTKEQLLDILQAATASHPDVLDRVRSLVDKDPVDRKIFVRGLGWDTSTDALKSVFSQFGELEEGVVIMDKNTGKSRGYGFVTFKHMDGVLQALKEPSKRIDGRMTVCQLASTGAAPVQPASDVVARKIYVGNVPLDLPADRLLNVFAQYGEIEEGPLGFDKQTGRLRGFALFIYKSAEAAKSALEEPVKVLDGHRIFCKLAVEGQRQKGGAPLAQPDASELPQSGGAFANPSNVQYGTLPQGYVTTGVPFNQGVNPGVNPAMNPPINSSLHPNFAVQSQNLAAANPSGNIPSNASVPSINPGVSQGQASLGLPSSYGAHPGTGLYGSQVAGYGGSTYSGGGAPAGSAYSGGGAPAGPAGSAYSGGGAPAGSAYSGGGAPAGSAYSGGGAPTGYGVPPSTVTSYTAGLQGTGQYAQVSYQNQQTSVPTGQRVPAVGLTPSIPPYYGA